MNTAFNYVKIHQNQQKTNHLPVLIICGTLYVLNRRMNEEINAIKLVKTDLFHDHGTLENKCVW